MDVLNFLTHISNYWKVHKDETFFGNVKYSKNGWILGLAFDKNISPD